MRIVIFTDTFFPSTDGVVTSILNTVSRLAERHAFMIIAPEYRQGHEIKLHKNITIVRVKSYPLPTYKDVRFVMPYYLHCLEEVRAFNPDVIHIETFATLGMLGARVAKALDKPLIGTYHTIAAEFIQYLLPASITQRTIETAEEPAPSKKSTAIDKTSRLMKAMVWKMTISLFRMCDIVTTPSAAIEKELKKRKLGRPTFVISNGTNTKLFKPKKTYRIKPNKILHVGRMSYEKNVDHTIWAFASIAKRNPNVQYDIIGSGPALRYLKALVHHLKLKKQVRFLGYIPNAELPKYYRGADLFITASPMETQGLVIIEAMASGLPVVGVDAYAIPNVVFNGKNGYVVPVDDCTAFANRMESLMQAPDRLERFGKQSHRIAGRHDIHKVVNEWEKLYSTAAQNAKKPRITK